MSAVLDNVLMGLVIAQTWNYYSSVVTRIILSAAEGDARGGEGGRSVG